MKMLIVCEKCRKPLQLSPEPYANDGIDRWIAAPHDCISAAELAALRQERDEPQQKLDKELGDFDELRSELTRMEDKEIVDKKERDELRAMLKEFEWYEADDGMFYCHICDRDKFNGHAPDCRLAALLKDAPK